MVKWEVTAVCADGRHLLWPPPALFWIPIYFGELQPFLPRNAFLSLLIRVYDSTYFIHDPEGNFSFPLCLQVEPLSEIAAGAGGCEVSSSGLFWQVLMCCGLNHWHCRTKLPTMGPCGPLHVVRIMKFDSWLPVRLPIALQKIDGRRGWFIDGWKMCWTVREMDGWMDGWKDGWKDGWMDGWKDGWKDGLRVGWGRWWQPAMYPGTVLTTTAPPWLPFCPASVYFATC